MTTPSFLPDKFYQQHAKILATNFTKLTKKKLINKPSHLITIEDLYNAPCVILSHDTQQPPIFNFGNKTALDLFEYQWDELITLPSQRSAEVIEREERETLLTKVSSQGFIDNYSGIRITANKTRFLIKKGIVWNLYDDNDKYYGQAATFNQWQFL